MESCNSPTYFLVCASPEEIRREKEKAKALRKTQWWQRQTGKGLCRYCGKSTPPGELTMDHLVPLIRGGRSTRGNVVAACKECNNRKKYLLPIEWEEYLRNLAGQGCSGKDTEARNQSEEDEDGKM
ncbi:MAG: HNH endonuclease [Acidobacteriota bacterium]